MAESPLLIERRGHVVILTLNRPHKMNALDTSLKAALDKAWKQIASDSEVRAVITTGQGDRAFCAGADAGMLQNAMENADTASNQPYPQFTARQQRLYKPVIAAVNGICAGAGLHFVADADVVIASENATFTDTHLDIGQVTAMEPIGLSRRISLGAVLRMVVLGREERIDAERALELGLVSEVVPLERLRDRAIELGNIAASKSPAAMEISLRSIWEGLDRGLSDAVFQGFRDVMAHRAHPDALEGPTAFMEKREPRWATK